MKRFTETDKWKDKWFRQLPMQYKLIWTWLTDNCDDAGVFDTDWQLIGFYVGFLEIDEKMVLEVFKDRITKIGGDTYIINKFIEFQYGALSLSCAPHLKVLRCLKKAGLCDYTIEIVKMGNQDRRQFKNINASAYGRVLGRVLGILPSRVHGTLMEEDKEEEEEEDKEKEGKGEGRKSKKVGHPLADLWNTEFYPTATRGRCTVVNASRLKSIKKAMQVLPSLDQWRLAMKELAGKDWVQGKRNHQGEVLPFSFDSIFEKDRYLKAYEQALANQEEKNAIDQLWNMGSAK